MDAIVYILPDTTHNHIWVIFVNIVPKNECFFKIKRSWNITVMLHERHDVSNHRQLDFLTASGPLQYDYIKGPYYRLS